MKKENEEKRRFFLMKPRQHRHHVLKNANRTKIILRNARNLIQLNGRVANDMISGFVAFKYAMHPSSSICSIKDDDR